MKKWIKTSERLPEYGYAVWVAGEMKYLGDPEMGTSDDEMEYFVGIGWLENEDEYKKYRSYHHNTNIPEDVDRWGTENDWYEGQGHYKITHWMEMEKPEHPIDSNDKNGIK